MQRVLIKLNIGIFYAVLAYGTWGLIPLYWKLFEALPEMEIICHRMIWSSVLLLGVSAMQQQLIEVKRLWRSPKTLAILLSTAALNSLNGGIYIYGVNSDRVLEASLGYFINPLFSIFLGFVFLREKLNIGQWIAVILVMIGVGYLIWEQGQIPWIAIGLTLSFGLYGLVRKLSTIQPIPGLAVESLLIAPIALALVMHWAKTGSGNFGLSLPLTFLLFSCGLVAPLPLLWFNLAVKRINLSTLGFLQYIEPTIQLILAVFLYQEPFTRTHLISFSLIWIAMAIYSSNSLISLNSNQKC